MLRAGTAPHFIRCQAADAKTNLTSVDLTQATHNVRENILQNKTILPVGRDHQVGSSTSAYSVDKLMLHARQRIKFLLIQT
ncbi:hypothetical protein RRG08_063356 [Elysia crispata]|uniref:Uncharacterized protein n=1 Tax=Elysia crispata TaxID=231223 RepID=A0AAE1B495_9GAST|nr:hypothetical protein RRG08_063356 [Elysia crispata]